jgi:hypothetical protein
MENKIKVIENFLDVNSVKALLEFSKSNPDLYLQTDFEPSNFWSKRTLPIFQHNIPTEIQNIGLTYLDLISKNISLAAGGEEVWCDTMNFVKWWDGYIQPPHADGEEPNGEPHPYPWRKFGCVYYLNDDFEGGEIHFPNFNIELKPKQNMVAFFPGDVVHLHGVRNVSKGIRHTLASFWGYDESYKMPIYDERR